MASNVRPIWTSSESSSSTSKTTGGDFTDPSIERVRQEQATARTGLTGLLEDARVLYQDLINKGRTADAFALQDATNRITRLGSQAGVSSWGRTQALQNLNARMRNAAAVSENQIIAQRLGQHQQVLGELSRVDNQAFNQALAIAQAKKQEEQQKFSNSMAEKQYADQQAAQAKATTLLQPKATAYTATPAKAPIQARERSFFTAPQIFKPRGMSTFGGATGWVTGASLPSTRITY